MQFSEQVLAVYMKKEYTMSVLEIKNLHVSVEDKEILKGLNLTLKTGEIAAIMVLTELVNLPSQLLLWVTQTMKSQKGHPF
mgnify:FL=1